VRRKPYTEIGITRVPCEKCGKPSTHQWQICATGNKWCGVCVECDIELNDMVLRFFAFPMKFSRSYAAAMRVLYNPENSKKAKLARGEGLTQRRSVP